MKNLAIIIGSILGLSLIGALIMAIIFRYSSREDEFSRADIGFASPDHLETSVEVVS